MVMYAEVGDRIVMRSQRERGRDRTGAIIESRQPDGSPPYLVRWDHDGREVILFPSEDAFFIRATHNGAA
jgi:hypothetical protein